MEVRGKHRIFVFSLVFFGILYSLISIVNHYCFRTYALDLGAYTNSLYDYIHFQWNDCGVFKGVGENLLADHFDLYLVFFSPLSLVLGTYTLLIVQILSVLFGGAGVYAYFKLSEKTAPVAIFASLFFYSFFGVFAAFSFDYHSNVVAASLVPWFFYLIRREKLFVSSILLLLILVSKENVSLWLAFVCIGLTIDYRRNLYLRKYLIFATVFSGIYFVFVTSILMPALSNNGSYPHFHYSFLGNNFSDALVHLISSPLDSMKALFTNHNNSPNGDFVKLELHLLLLFSGLPFLIRKPQYVLMLVPVYFQKLFHDDSTMWGIGGQYSIEFVPIMAIGIFMVIAEFNKAKLISIISVVVLFFTIASTLRTMDSTIFYTVKSRIRFYQSDHYQRPFDIRKVHQQLSNIPQDAIVSVQSPFLPHLALRDNVYQFPIIKNADYIIYSEKETTYPLTKEEFVLVTTKLENSHEWEVINDEDIKILKKSDCNN